MMTISYIPLAVDSSHYDFRTGVLDNHYPILPIQNLELG